MFENEVTWNVLNVVCLSGNVLGRIEGRGRVDGRVDVDEDGCMLRMAGVADERARLSSRSLGSHSVGEG